MTAPSMLFICGDGIISSAVSALALERGVRPTLLNRPREIDNLNS